MEVGVPVLVMNGVRDGVAVECSTTGERVSAGSAGCGRQELASIPRAMSRMEIGRIVITKFR
jgi:hypothetical protein